ncbi:unnamed protein product [Sympodiomycopsis kandeliae]
MSHLSVAEELLQDLLNRPSLFDDLKEAQPELERSPIRMSVLRGFHSTNKANGLPWSEEDLNDTLKDAITGYNGKDGLEVAHLLPHRLSKEPALWLFARLTGIAPWVSPTVVRNFKQSSGNLVPLPHAFHRALDRGQAEVLLRPTQQTYKQLCWDLEQWLSAEEINPTLSSGKAAWHWKLDCWSEHCSKNAPRVNDLPLLGFAPMLMPMSLARAPQALTYEFQSPEGVLGSEFATLQINTAAPNTTSFPLQYVTRFETGWRPGNRQNNELRDVLLPLCPFIMAASDRMAIKRRATSGNHDAWSDLVPTNDQLVSRDFSDRISKIQEYFFRLVCSPFPSAFRAFQRPGALDAQPIPPAPTSLNYTPREWSMGTVGPGRPSFNNNDPDSSEEGVITTSGRWSKFLAAWRKAPRPVSQLDLRRLTEEPISTASVTQDDLAAEVQRFRTACVQAGYATVEDLDPIGKSLHTIEEDLSELTLDIVRKEGLMILLDKGEEVLPGLSSLRCLMHALERAWFVHNNVR